MGNYTDPYGTVKQGFVSYDEADVSDAGLLNRQSGAAAPGRVTIPECGGQARR
ncbi:MAG: hypothetical protein PVI63_01910 [Anaerolineae bacterium]|jgi:hypothetical protein